jgi:hypothetical protein
MAAIAIIGKPKRGKPETRRKSYGDGGFDCGVGVVTDQFKVLEAEVIHIANIRIEAHSGKRAGFPGELFGGLFEVI